jgi:MFS transporter, ACS family, allantoate permease
MLTGLNGKGQKGALLFGECLGSLHHNLLIYFDHLASYLIGTFASALSTIYAYNASNTSGHTKKVIIHTLYMITKHSDASTD